MKLMDALNRIERAGGEDSKSTAKLKDAATIVAAEILTKILKETNVNDWQNYNRGFGDGGSIFGKRLDISSSPFSHFYASSASVSFVYLFARRCVGSWFIDFVCCGSELAHATVWDEVNGNEALVSENRIGQANVISREDAMRFVEHCARGLLANIAETIEQRSAQAMSGISTVQKTQVLAK